MATRIIKLVLTTILCTSITEVIASSSSNTKQYCDPLDLNKYSPAPVNVSDKSLSAVTDAFESGIIEGNFIDTETKKLNDSPTEIFTLTSQVVTELARERTKSSPMMNTQTVIGVSLVPDRIIYNQKDVIQTILDGVFSSVVGELPSNGTLIFPGSTSATSTSNNSNAQQQSINTQNSTKLVGQLNYNDVVNTSLCGYNPATSTTSTGSLDITQIYINSKAISYAIQGCNDTMPTSSSSSSSSTTSSTTDTATSQFSSTTGTGGSSGNLMKNSLQACSAAIGACELNYIQSTIGPQISNYINAQIQNEPQYASIYNDVVEQLNNILGQDLSEFSTSTGMVFPANCLQASCSGGSCATASEVQTEIGVMNGFLTTINKQLHKLAVIKLNDMVAQCEETKSTNYSSQDYFVNPGLNLSSFLNMDSFGTPNSNSSMQCSQKTQYKTELLTAISDDLINKTADSVKIPNLFAPNIPFGDETIVQAGSFGNINNQNNFANYSQVIPAVTNTRTKSSAAIIGFTNTFNTLVQSFISQKSLAIANLRYLMRKKSTLTPIPTVFHDNKFDNSCKEGINNPDSSNCNFTTPYQNISKDWNLTAGQICSTAELENMQATWRTRPGPDNSINPWQQKIKFASGNDVAKSKVYLLAEIKQQNQTNKELKDRILATKSSSLLVNMSASKASMMQYMKNIDASVKKFIQGS